MSPRRKKAKYIFENDPRIGGDGVSLNARPDPQLVGERIAATENTGGLRPRELWENLDPDRPPHIRADPGRSAKRDFQR